MKDLNQIPVARLPHGKTQLRSGSPLPIKLFLDDWPAPPRCIDESDGSSSLEVKKWRLQILLAVNPYGIPSLKFGEAYERMFGRKFDLHDFGFDNLSDMINKMQDIFVVQEPDETTAILFPDYPSDKILHDARLGHNFARPNIDGTDSLLRPSTRVQASGTKSDFDDLIIRAWIDRDEEFPADVVLAGESYEQLLKLSSAKIPGTIGLYQATVISAASPESIFIQLKTNDEDQARIRGLSNEIKEYFKNSKHSIDAYNVPKEFLLPGFPCLVYSSKEKNWERCIVVGQSHGDNKVLVESIDFGGAYSVHKIFLYLIPRQFLDIPRQTLHVSVMGMKPIEPDGRWTQKVGSRLRCFSFAQYYLDVLLTEPKMQEYDVSPPPETDSSTSSRPPPSSETGAADIVAKVAPKTKRRFKSKMTYEALIVDRNDKDMDIYLDEILVLETYALRDESRAEEIGKIKEHLHEAFKGIPRPKNPFE
uniref:Tudor domain-containing protein 5 n=1 Tax=Aceria tosichella TaxID=561515 RepID=A0A6G1SLZ2_9ACAR